MAVVLGFLGTALAAAGGSALAIATGALAGGTEGSGFAGSSIDMACGDSSRPTARTALRSGFTDTTTASEARDGSGAGLARPSCFCSSGGTSERDVVIDVCFFCGTTLRRSSSLLLLEYESLPLSESLRSLSLSLLLL